MIGEAQLFDYKARAYSPSLGRFLQTDPIGYASDLNPYAYVGDDPLSFSDPFGLQQDQQCDPICPTVDELVVTGQFPGTNSFSQPVIANYNSRYLGENFALTPGVTTVAGLIVSLRAKGPGGGAGSFRSLPLALRFVLAPKLTIACLIAPFVPFEAGVYSKASAGSSVGHGVFLNATAKVGFNGKGGVDMTLTAAGTQEAGFNAFGGFSGGFYEGNGGQASGGFPSRLRGRAGELLGVEFAGGPGGASVGGTLGVGTPVGASVTAKEMPLASKRVSVC